MKVNLKLEWFRKITKNFLNVVLASLCVVLLLITTISGMLLYKYIGNPGQVPSIFGYNTANVLSGSMKPDINPGDVIISKTWGFENLKSGDIITYKSDTGLLITHRIISRENKDGKLLFRTKGDANNAEDKELIPVESVVGVYNYRIPYVGFLGKFAMTQKGIITFASGIILFLSFDKVKAILSKLAKKKKYDTTVKDNVEI